MRNLIICYLNFIVNLFAKQEELLFFMWNSNCLIFSSFLLRRFRSFQRGTVGLCRSNSCRVMSCQSWRFEKNSAARPESNHKRAARARLPDGKIISKVWWTTTLQPFDLQRPTIPLRKDLNLPNIHSSINSKY